MVFSEILTVSHGFPYFLVYACCSRSATLGRLRAVEKEVLAALGSAAEKSRVQARNAGQHIDCQSTLFQTCNVAWALHSGQLPPPTDLATRAGFP